MPAAVSSGTGPPLPSPKQLAWLPVRPVAALSSHEAAAVAQVEQDDEAARVADLARRFTALVRSRGTRRGGGWPAPCADFDGWLAEARACGVRTIETFALGLEQDEAAVRAALTTLWSNGQAEARSPGSRC